MTEVRRLVPRDVYAARRRIGGLVPRVVPAPVPALTDRLGVAVWLQDETRQPTGSFKVRGAANKLLSLSEDARRRGVVAVSTGNHGRAVAWVGARLGVPVTVCVSTRVPRNKLDAIRALGARLVVIGESQDEAEVEGRRLVDEEDLTYVPPFDDPEIVAGQGTIGLDILEAVPDVGTVVIPLSGGGLAGGIALVLKAADRRIRVVGVSMEQGAAMHASLDAGRPVEMLEADTLADSLQGGIGSTNSVTFELARTHLDDVLLVPEEAIADAMRFAFREHRLVLEGGGAVAVAAALQSVLNAAEERGPVVLVASGGNVDPDAFLELVGRRDPSAAT